jgi:hypothetical protein
MSELQPSSNQNNPNGSNKQNHPIRRLLVFQVKLAFDALRDILLSPVSFVATLIDLAQKRKGKDSYFEHLMHFGRESEKRINLFDQHNDATNVKQSVDSFVDQVEEVLKREYRKGGMTEKTKAAIEKKLSLKK